MRAARDGALAVPVIHVEFKHASIAAHGGKVHAEAINVFVATKRKTNGGLGVEVAALDLRGVERETGLRHPSQGLAQRRAAGGTEQGERVGLTDGCLPYAGRDFVPSRGDRCRDGSLHGRGEQKIEQSGRQKGWFHTGSAHDGNTTAALLRWWLEDFWRRNLAP